MSKANKQPLTTQEETALAKLSVMPDEQIDYSDIPSATPEQWREAERGRFYRPVKQQLTLRIDADVIAWYKSQGRGYQTRINEILRQAMQEEIKHS